MSFSLVNDLSNKEFFDELIDKLILFEVTKLNSSKLIYSTINTGNNKVEISTTEISSEFEKSEKNLKNSNVKK